MFAVLLAVLAAGCGADDPAPAGSRKVRESGGSADDLYSAATGPFRAENGTRRQIDQLLAAGCAAIVEDPGGDNLAFRHWIQSLFADPGGTPPELYPDAIWAALSSACENFDADPRDFVERMGERLDIDSAALVYYLDGACRRFRNRAAANVDDRYAPPVFDPIMTAVVESAGIQREEIGPLVEAYCEAAAGARPERPVREDAPPPPDPPEAVEATSPRPLAFYAVRDFGT